MGANESCLDAGVDQRHSRAATAIAKAARRMIDHPVCAICFSRCPAQRLQGWPAGCRHAFCPDCVDSCLSRSGACPLCRAYAPATILRNDDLNGDLNGDSFEASIAVMHIREWIRVIEQMESRPRQHLERVVVNEVGSSEERHTNNDRALLVTRRTRRRRSSVGRMLELLRKVIGSVASTADEAYEFFLEDPTPIRRDDLEWVTVASHTSVTQSLGRTSSSTYRRAALLAASRRDALEAADDALLTDFRDAARRAALRHALEA